MPTDLVYRLSDLCFASDAPIPELKPANGDVETRVTWHAPAPAASVPLPTYATWLTDDGDVWLAFADRPGGFRLTFPEHGIFDVATDASTVDVRPFPDTPDETVRHLLLNQVLPLVLSRRGRIVLHASAVSVNDQVCAFIGRSGAGKSTLAVACAHAGAAVVSDDCLVVYPREGRWLAVPCHAGVRLWPDALTLLGWETDAGTAAAHYTDKRRIDSSDSSDAVDAGRGGVRFESRHLPLAAILHMRTPADPLTRTGPIHGRDAVMALASEVFRLDWRDAEESRRQFAAIGALAASIPVESPLRQPPAEAAERLLCRMTAGWRSND